MILKETQDAIDLFKNELIVGNHDSLTLYGTFAQNQLIKYSRTISNIFTNSNDELENEINNVVLELEKFETHTITNRFLLLSGQAHRKFLTNKYYKLIQYIEKITLCFQLQQAQIIKENKLLDKLSETVSTSAVALQKCINEGEQKLLKRSMNELCEDENLKTWYSRLEKKLDDLRVSHTIALQNLAQIKILYNNNLLVLDRLSATVSNTFPIWQNQIIMLLGVEKLKERLEKQNKISSLLHSKEKLDVDGILEINANLKEELKEAIAFEKKGLEIRRDFKSLTQNIERGKHYE